MEKLYIAQSNTLHGCAYKRNSLRAVVQGESPCTTTVVYTGFRGWGEGPGSNGGGYFLDWRNQKFRVFSNSKIFKKC